MEHFLTNLIGADNFQKYGINIMFFGSFFTVIALIYFIIFILCKIRNFIPDKMNECINPDENIMLIVDKQIPTIYISALKFPFITFFTLIAWMCVTGSNGSFLLTALFTAIWLYIAYFFINPFFIKLIITDKRILYRDLFNLNYNVISITNIESISANMDVRVGDLLDIKIKEQEKKISLSVVKKAKEAQAIIEKIILTPDEAEKVREERAEKAKKEKVTPLQLVIITAVVIIYAFIRFGLRT